MNSTDSTGINLTEEEYYELLREAFDSLPRRGIPFLYKRMIDNVSKHTIHLSMYEWFGTVWVPYVSLMHELGEEYDDRL